MFFFFCFNYPVLSRKYAIESITYVFQKTLWKLNNNFNNNKKNIISPHISPWWLTMMSFTLFAVVLSTSGRMKMQGERKSSAPNNDDSISIIICTFKSFRDGFCKGREEEREGKHFIALVYIINNIINVNYISLTTHYWNLLKIYKTYLVCQGYRYF